MKKLLKNRKGMTLAEILVAFTILVLVVFVFSPMLLSSYQHLYAAGERQASSYDARSFVEERLSKRDVDAIKRFTMNLNGLNSNIETVGRKIVYNIVGGDALETFFHGAKASVRIISPSVVYDNSETQNVSIQTFNINYNGVEVNAAKPTVERISTSQVGTMPIYIAAFAPDKTQDTSGTTTDDAAYENGTGNKLTIANHTTSENSSQSIISFDIKNGTGANAKLNFTNSPVKILVYYYNDRGHLKTVSDYLYIEPMKLLMAGTTTNADYYTSAGVVTKIDKVAATDAHGNPTTIDVSSSSFEVEARQMPIDNSNLAKNFDPSIKGIEFMNVSYITEDTTDYYEPYFVLTGTKGAIYRMYDFNQKVGYGASTMSDVAKVGHANGTTDNVLRTGEGTIAYPALWSGETTEQFGYGTYKRAMGYAYPSIPDEDDPSCWYTQDGTTGRTANGYKKFGMQVRHAYSYNGMKTGYVYESQRNRRISYILTESGYPLRTSASMQQMSDYKGYNNEWEKFGGDRTNIYIDGSGDRTYPAEATITGSLNRVIYYRSRIGAIGGTTFFDDRYSRENSQAYLRITSMNNLNNTSSGASPLFSTSEYNDGEKNGRKSYLDLENATNTVTITNAVYDVGMGGMFYTGSVSANTFMLQLDNTSTDIRYAYSVYTNGNTPVDKTGKYTGYYVSGTNSGSVIKKLSSDDGGYSGILSQFASGAEGTATTNLANFYADRSTSLKKADLRDVNVTFGYSSNRNGVFGQITYNGGKGGGNTEAYKSYEKYYFLSHYGNADAKPNYYSKKDADSTGALGGNYNANLLNSYNNDYYNVWFPGEYYNITKSVSKYGLTVAVGYAVSGSSYQWLNPNAANNSSTGLGSVFNDGVLAVKTSEDQTLSNKLYFKDNATFDSTSLTNKAVTQQNWRRVFYGVSKSYKEFLGDYKWSGVFEVTSEELYDGRYSGTKYGDFMVGPAVTNTVSNYGTVVSTIDPSVTHANGNSAVIVNANYDGVDNGNYPAVTDSNNKNISKNPAVCGYYTYETKANLNQVGKTNVERYRFSTDWAGTLTNTAQSNYGTHSRRSIQFTAVDLVSEENGSGATATRQFYAYYGDNTGRVFKSLVATANDVSSGGVSISGTVTAVPFIKDTTYAGTAAAAANAGSMEEVRVNGNSLTEYFSKIVSITANDDLIIISGEPKNSTSSAYVVVGSKYRTNTAAGDEHSDAIYAWNWRVVTLSGIGSAFIKDAVIVDGYYYAVGATSQTSSAGFLIAVPVTSIAYSTENTATTVTPLVATVKRADGSLVTADVLNCISGHATT